MLTLLIKFCTNWIHLFWKINTNKYVLFAGNVIFSSIEYGLFTVRPNQSAIRAAIGQQAYREQTRSREIKFASPHATCPSLVQPRDCTATDLEAEATP